MTVGMASLAPSDLSWNTHPTRYCSGILKHSTRIHPLRTLVLVLLALFVIMGIVGVAQSIPYAGRNGIFRFDLFGLALDVLGFFAVYRLIPEHMIAYGWALMALLVVNVIRFITWAVFGSFDEASVTLILQVLFTFSMVGCMYSLRAYALSCRGIAI